MYCDNCGELGHKDKDCPWNHAIITTDVDTGQKYITDDPKVPFNPIAIKAEMWRQRR